MGNLNDYAEKLKREQEKLNMLIDKALNEPIQKNDEILQQSHIVDELLQAMQKDKENN